MKATCIELGANRAASGLSSEAKRCGNHCKARLPAIAVYPVGRTRT